METKIIHHLINTVSMTEKLGCYWIYGLSTLGVSKSCNTLGKPRALHDFDTLRVEWRYIQWQPMKESYIHILGSHIFADWNITQSELECTTYLYAIHTAPRHMCLRQKIATEQVWRGSTPHLKSLLCTQKTQKMPEMIRALWIQTDHWYKTYAQINRNRIWISSICKEIIVLIHVDIQSCKFLWNIQRKLTIH